MHQVLWRLSYGVASLAASLRLQSPNWLVVAYFMTPGNWRTKLFGPTFVANQFLKKYDLGECTVQENVIVVRAGELVFDIPKTGFEQGDVFDILVPYLMTTHPTQKDSWRTWMERNTNRFYDGPYLSAYTTLTAGNVVMDAEASVGLFCVIASKLVGTTGRIFAAEPIAEVRAFLEKNIDANACTNITILPIALGEEDKAVTFTVNLGPHFEGSSKYLERGGEKRTIEQKKVDTIASEQNLTINFIKADIEGSERDLLTGSEETLRRDHPQLAIRTYHLPDDQEVPRSTVEAIGDYDYVIEGGTTLYAWPAAR